MSICIYSICSQRNNEGKKGRDGATSHQNRTPVCLWHPEVGVVRYIFQNLSNLSHRGSEGNETCRGRQNDPDTARENEPFASNGGEFSVL